MVWGIWRGWLGGVFAALMLSVSMPIAFAQTEPQPAQSATSSSVKAPAITIAKPAPSHQVAAKPAAAGKVAAAKPPAKKLASTAKKSTAPTPGKLAAAKKPVKQVLAAKKPAAPVKVAAIAPKLTTAAPKLAAAEPKAAPPPRPVTSVRGNAAGTAHVVPLAPLTVTAASAPAPAAQPVDAKTAATAYVTTFLRDAFRLAKLPGATSLQRRAQLADLFAGKMDVNRIAGYTTADGLTKLSPELQQRFRTILVSYLVETYYPQLELASDPGVRVETAAAEPLSDGTAVVWTTFTKDGWGSQSVKWLVAPGSGGYKVVDIFSAGASLVQMERDTFQSVMRDGGVNNLMSRLDARTKELASAATD